MKNNNSKIMFCFLSLLIGIILILLYKENSMANIDKVQLPDGSEFNIVDNTSHFATENYVDNAVDSITKTTIGLGNVDNTSDMDKPVSTAQQAAIDAIAQKDRRVIVISDSYGLGRNSTTAFTTYLQQYLGLSNDNYYTWSEGSMGFNRAGDGGHTVEQLLSAHISDVTERDTITDVIFALGANDTLATSGLRDAIVSCVEYTKTQFPNAKVHIGFIGNVKDKPNSTTYGNYIKALNAYKTACGLCDASYISGCEYVLHNNSLLQADGVHPTNEGSCEIANFISAYLKGTPYEYSYYDAFNLTGAITVGVSVNACGSVTELAFGQGNIFSSAVNVTRSGAVIASNTNANAYVTPTAPLYFKAVAYNGTEFVHVTLTYSNGVLKVHAPSSFTIPVQTPLEQIQTVTINTLTV